MKKMVRKVKRTGDPKVAYTLDTPPRRVEKEDFVMFEDPSEGWKLIYPIDYGEHFIYADPVYAEAGGQGRWFAMCTCGSPAVIVNPDVLQRVLQMTDPDKAMLVCYVHTLLAEAYGLDHAKHITGGSRWI